MGDADLHAGAAGTTILVLDDDDTLREAAGRALEFAGYRVLTASWSHEALRIADAWEGDIHLLVCDLVLPDLNGRELANILEARRPSLKVLFTSGFSSAGSFRRDLERNAWWFLPKPFDVTALLTAVRECLDTPRPREPQGGK